MIRPSTEVKIERAGAVLVRLVVGLLMFAFGTVFDFFEYHPPPAHTIHVAIFTGIAFFGLLVAAGTYLFPVIQKVVVIAGQTNLPFVGRRRDDLPAPPAKPGDQG